jgi:hypothetical protein
MERIVFSHPPGQPRVGQPRVTPLPPADRGTLRPARDISRIQIIHNLMFWNDLDVLQNGNFTGRWKPGSGAAR